jgi:alcohol dehydrogenase (cytochrome c)
VTRIENITETFKQGEPVHFCPGSCGGAEWNGPSYVPQTNLILIGEVDYCETAQPKTLDALQRVKVGDPWTGVATLNPFWLFGRFDRAWGGWLYAVDADTGVWKWRVKTNYPIIGGVTPTAGGIVFFGDIGGNFYALDSTTGQKLWGQDLGGNIGGGVITYTAGGSQKVAVAAGLSMIAWNTKPVHAKVVVLGLANAKQ